MNSKTTTKTTAMNTGLRPRFAIYHPNGKGTGCAMKMELHPAHADHDGYIMMCVAAQKTVGEGDGASRKFPTFDWENRIWVKLDFSDICKILQVLRGECESLGDGKGLYHRSARFSTRIVLRHLTEPIQGYSLEIYRDAAGDADGGRSAHLVLNPWEALGVGISFENAIGLICFGVPQVMARERADNELEEASYDVPA